MLTDVLSFLEQRFFYYRPLFALMKFMRKIHISSSALIEHSQKSANRRHKKILTVKVLAQYNVALMRSLFS